MAHILVVDDHPDLGTVVARMLRHGGHEAACVLDGEAALDHVRATPTSLVILDVMMPGLDGFDVLAEMRADPRTRAVPVVMYSARSDAAARRRAMELGAQDYLVKSDVTYEQLRAVVERYAEAA